MDVKTDKGSFSVDGIGVAVEKPLGMLQLAEPVIFPGALVAVQVEGEENCPALEAAMADDRMLAVFNMLPPAEELSRLPENLPVPESFQCNGNTLCAVGMSVRVVKDLKFPDGSHRIVVRGLKRIRFVSLMPRSGKFPLVRYRVQVESEGDNRDVNILAKQRSVLTLFQELFASLPMLPPELGFETFVNSIPARCADLISGNAGLDYAEKLVMLAAADVDSRLDLLTVLLNRAVITARLGMKIQNQVQENMGEQQKEYFLREQLKTIRKELGELCGDRDVAKLTRKMESLALPEKVAETIKAELERLEVIPQNAPEYHISYNYVSWLLDVPWQVHSDDCLNVRKASAILDEDHYGLQDVKSRILEFLSVMQLRAGDERAKAPILCLVGPPGVGKTSIGRSIARAMNRQFIRVSLGGVRDEAEIRGHRRTYVGAMPGRIVQNLKRAGTCNPVFMLDEVDKLAHDFRGDPASALLEVLDPEQNFAFNDNFIELPVDLSKIFFIATANVLEEIPGPLRDRMEVITVPGYTAPEKKEIARRYLIRKAVSESGLEPYQPKFSLPAINEMIDYYTSEAGVRGLERVIAQVCRKLAQQAVAGELAAGVPVKVTPAMIGKLLGVRKFSRAGESAPQIGCATGLAWTAVGGVVLPIETQSLKGGTGALKLTGSLGKVMQESAETAFTFVRKSAEQWDLPLNYFREHDFHIHAPDGATPKDGPSAGITIALALSSLLQKKSLPAHLAMTGEITLQGRITAIGGVREKLVGAIRAGVKYILIPEENRKDVLELPDYVLKELSFCFVSDFRTVLDKAFRTTEFVQVRK